MAIQLLAVHYFMHAQLSIVIIHASIHATNAHDQLMHTHLKIDTHLRTHKYIYIHIIIIATHMHAHTCIRTYNIIIRMHARTQTHMHTDTHIHTHNLPDNQSGLS